MDGRMMEGGGETAELRNDIQPQLVVHRQPMVQMLGAQRGRRSQAHRETQLSNGHSTDTSSDHKKAARASKGVSKQHKVRRESEQQQIAIANSLAILNAHPKFSKYSRHILEMDISTLKIGCAGLGRMGKRHADHFLHKVPRATLVAVSTPSDDELRWAKEHLEPYGVTLFKSYDEMLRHPGLQAVVIASVTTVHAEQAIKAIELDKHVLCEKPLSTEACISESVVTAAANAPHLKVMCGFSRRFDDSYRDAISRVSAGAIGTPSIFRSQTCDKWDPSGAFIDYAKFSGGIFVDCSIHDIDLCLWFFSAASSARPSENGLTNGNGEARNGTGGSKKEGVKVKSVQAVGVTAIAPELRQYDDVDNAVGVVEFWDERVAYFYCSRMMVAGQEDCTEIIGTGGKVSVNMSPQRNLVSLHEAGGIRKEIPQDYFQRFENAFVKEGAEFVKCCLDGGDVPVPLKGAVKAVEIGCALQESLRNGGKIEFDEEGTRKVRSRL